MKKEIATEINRMLVTQYEELNRSIFLVKDNCTEDEFNAYLLAVGGIMGDMYFKIMRSIQAEYPELEPEALRKALGK